MKLEGYIDSKKKGVWVLTESGFSTHLSDEDARKIFLKWVAYFQDLRQKKAQGNPAIVTPEEPDEEEVGASVADTYRDHRELLLSVEELAAIRI